MSKQMPSIRKTVLITGCSTGIGRAAVKYFYSCGWNVVATMRSPEREKEFTDSMRFDEKRILCMRLDVTDFASIEAAFRAAVKKFERIDVVVNNAGYGLMGVFESFTAEQIERQFKTNVLGLVEVSRHAAKHFREKGVKNGVLINVSSVVGQIVIPLYSIYCATKFAVEGFSEALQYELAEINARVKLVEPGTTATDFFTRSTDRPVVGSVPHEYFSLSDAVAMQTKKFSNRAMTSESVAEVIYRAATDGTSRLRYPVGIRNRALLVFRKFIPEFLYRYAISLLTKWSRSLMRYKPRVGSE